MEPFTFLNNGDWVGQIVNKLRVGVAPHSTLYPNGNAALIQDQINEWIKSKIKQMSAHDLAEIMAGAHKDK